MKIRTDFVTNSSSSGYVCIVVTFKDGREYEMEYEYDSGYGGYAWNYTDPISVITTCCWKKVYRSLA